MAAAQRHSDGQRAPAAQVAVILSNPEQSKHLETARLKLAGLEIDLVNLRSESYADSRIPTMDIGTPEEDALRRAPAAGRLRRACGPERVPQGAARGRRGACEHALRRSAPTWRLLCCLCLHARAAHREHEQD